ncbi:phage tail protein [Pseudomonas sp. FFUP_PS_473]|uniref:phage tail assembly chaperone n=1 Tax=Pseudomonas sp. FFUP_PS_473 TaxID=2060418 RepID=UPI000C7CF0D3|nr:phage tail assembly chaperone [Pseudomonas sp. FFUP_PS_473]PLP87427.1 phage tail protein [Pseudomonas sp. FFUP_PS_473]
MGMLYSRATQATYIEGLHAEIPADAVPIDRARYLAVIGNPEPGKVRSHDDAGLPILIDPPAQTLEQQAEQERQWRDSVLVSLVWLRDRHRDQLEIGAATTLSAEQFAELLVYMQALRDWPQSEQFPVTEYRPVAPPWIAEQHQ